MGKGYDSIYTGLLPRLKDCDFKESAERLGARYDACSDCVGISFLNREFIITRGEVRAKDGQTASVNILSLLIYYITSRGAGGLSHNFAKLNWFTGLIEGQNMLADSMMTTRLEQEFAGDCDRFGQVILSLGGEEISEAGKAKRVFQIAPLPKLLARIVYYEADAEFPAEMQIMFDQTASRFLDFECLAFLCGSMVETFIESGKAQKTGEL